MLASITSQSERRSSTYALPREPDLVVHGRKAAYCARRLNGGAYHLTAQDMEDMIQTATLAYGKHQSEGRSVPFCFVCARQAAEKYFYCRIFGRNPRRPFSLDAPVHGGGDLPHGGRKQQRAREIQLTYPDQQKPVPAQ